jgi:uncharacterized membrane protein
MPNSQYKRNAELKYLARMQTSHYMGILIGALLLNIVLSYVAVDIIASIIPSNGTVGYIINYIVTFIVQVLVSVLDVGVAYIFMKSACNMRSGIKDLFFGYKHHFSRALIIGFILVVINSICMIPVEIASVQFADLIDNNAFFNNYISGGLGGLMMDGSAIDSYELMESYSVFTSSMMKYYGIVITCSLVSFLLTLPFFPAYYMLLDFPNQRVSEILKKCFSVMHGNIFRLFLMYLSFLPLMLLSMFTCGIALIWVYPYMKMTATNFYLDMMAVRNKNMHFNKTV